MADDTVKKIDVVSASSDTSATNPFTDVEAEMRARFELLPDDIKKAIIDDAYQTKLFEIAKAQKLTYDELNTLEIETSMVLLGMNKPEEYRNDLQTELKKNDPEIDALVKAVNEQVFAPIRASLEKLYATKKDPEDYASPEARAEYAAATPAPTLPTAPVPLPAMPAKEEPKPIPAPSLSTEDHAILAKTGVVISETPKAAAPMQAAQMPNRTDLLKGIENPQRTPSLGIVADKLNSAGPAMPTKSTDYSVAKSPAPAPTQTPPTKTGPDPYREPIN